MSNEIVVGLVKKKAFANPAHVRSTMLNPHIEYSLMEFNENTSTVFRVAGLSGPVEYPSLEVPDQLCKKALAVAIFVLSHHPELHKVPFTIIDGTSWDKAIGTRGFGLDIRFINVFWQDEKPVIAVHLMERKLVKTEGKMYHLDGTVGFPIIFPFDRDKTENDNLAEMRKAVAKPGNGGSFYEFGKCIAEALALTCQPDLEYPVAAATYLDDVIWYVDRPHRHFHIVHSQEFHEAQSKLTGEETVGVQGFLTNHGNFVNRYRGMFMAVQNSMIIDTPPVILSVKGCEEKMYREVERQMGGILHEADRMAAGYRVADVALFSEDMW